MRILQTPARFYPFVGGVERVVWAVSRELVRNGHDVTVLCAAEPENGPGEIDGIRVVRLPYIGKVANTNITPGLPRRLLGERFDIIHTHLPTPWSADLSVVLGRLRGSGVVMTYHNDIVGQGAGGTIAAAYNASLLRLSLALSHRIVVNSPSVATRRGSPLRAHRRKVAIVPNGVDTEALYPSLEQRSTARIGFMSALDDFHAYKGLPILLAAMRQVVSAYPEAQLLVGGSGSRLADYRRLAAHLGLAGSVQFLGFVPEDELRDFFNRCSLFVLPSTDRLREGFGLVALEAMACGVPVVVSRAAGMARLLEKDNLGTVVPTGDPAALAAAVNAALQNSEQAMEQGLAGRAAVETCYSWKGVVARLESLYRECLQEAR